MSVPNQFPTVNLGNKLAIIGDAPGEKEMFMKQPFIGANGNLLNAVLQSLQIPRSGCFVGNLCQVQPPRNDFAAFSRDTMEVQHGMAQLKRDLERFNPNAVLLLGTWAVRYAGIDLRIPTEKKTDDDQFTIYAFRGTIFECNDLSSPFFGRKCIATLHPSMLQVGKSPEKLPLFKHDVTRGWEQSKFPGLRLPQRQLDVDLTCSEICRRLDAIEDGTLVSLDIEGGVKSITCISFALHENAGFIVNWLDFSTDEKVRLLRSVGRVLCNERIPKVLQNALYENFVLPYVLKMPVRGVIHDTMLSGWETFPELPKGLGTQASIWTEEPYYKFERKVHDKRVHYQYCIKDSCVTKEINLRHSEFMSDAAKAHYNFNVSLLPALSYMQLKGFRYNQELAADKLAEVQLEQSEIALRMKTIAGRVVNPNCSQGKNSLVNILYNELGFEPQYKKEAGRKTNTKTADVEALLRLVKTDTSGLIYHILKWRQLDGVRKQLEITCDPDGRVRCSYNLVGTDTGRMTCYESPTESGTNLQTITAKLRCLYRADIGKVLLKCDLAGADGWTVAAHSNRLGDSTMLTDYLHGIKPARVIAAMRQDSRTSQLPYEQLKTFISEMSIPPWLYFTCKRVQHGSNYGLGKITMSSVILKDSWKMEGEPIFVTAADCAALQDLYLNGRYRGVAKWQQWVTRQLFDSRQLSCASGHVRTFFGPLGFIDKPNVETWKAALSHEPQANTTFAVNRVLYNLWHDTTNWDSRGCLIIEPLHQVHDEIVMQVDESKLEWALNKVRQWFSNPLRIAEQEITIPFEGGYGPSWGEAKTKFE